MNLKISRMICVVCFIAAICIPSVVFSQGTEQKPAQQAKEQPKEGTAKKIANPGDQYPPDQKPEENYLARFKAIEVSEQLMKENLDNIYVLKVIVSNFKEQGWEKDSNDIYDEYKKAVAKYYRRQVIYSRLELERNKKHINDLFKKIVAVYSDQASGMLDECADKILNFSLDERNRLDPNRSRTLFQNMMRLWIAYGQVDDADSSSLDNMFKSAVYHLRIAKAYAVQILEELNPESANAEKYRVIKADNMNRVFYTEGTKSTAPGPQTSPSTVK